MKSYRPSQHPDAGNLKRAKVRKWYHRLDTVDINYLRNHPDESASKLAEILRVDRMTIYNWRKKHGA